MRSADAARYLNQKAHEPRAHWPTSVPPRPPAGHQRAWCLTRPTPARQRRSPAGGTLLRTAIDRADAGELRLDAHQRHNVRNAIANYSREWGVIASAGFRSARQAATNVGGAAIST